MRGSCVVWLERRGLIYIAFMFGKSSFGTENLKAWINFCWERASNPDYRDFCSERLNLPALEARKETGNSQQLSVG